MLHSPLNIFHLLSQTIGSALGLGKTFAQTLKSNLDLNKTQIACKKVCLDSGLKLKDESAGEASFGLVASEPMKWLSTNWPNSITISGEVFEDRVLVKLSATSAGTSLTQDKNISDFLDNFATSLNAYVS
jgi:hypothetical protein